ncbi:MAG: D-alanyl-D-alanine carboxypeptidase/D-alanyl-D-alanine-endopeptidase [Acidobacteria bacterium]|nr:D-alanyl-D-alanine carboxypeptidase/D-alanyl-D-alanine-endopeptidase [Acidobacteriota bacterium]
MLARFLRRTTKLASLALAAAALLPAVSGAQSTARGTATGTAAQSRLDERIIALTSAAQFRAARWGVFAIDLESGEVLASIDAGRRFLPASNMKLYTTALALAKLGPGYRWRTSVFAEGRPDVRGRLAGDLVLYGRGDPSISDTFGAGVASRKIDELADRVAASGVKRVAGNLVADESYFPGKRFGYGWEWNDLQWGYGAEVSALSVGDNVVSLTVTPAPKAGEPCSVALGARNGFVRYTNRTRTSPKQGLNDLGVYRAESSNVIDVFGHVPVDAPKFDQFVAVHDPAGYFGALLRDALARRGIVVEGRTLTADSRMREVAPFDTAAAVELAAIESEPLSSVVRETNKQSQNLYAELLLRTVGRVAGPATETTSEAAGIKALNEFLRAAGVDVVPLLFSDGSGLSRQNLITPEATVRLLAYARKQPFGDVLFASLPEAGVDGTLEKRFRETAGTSRIRAKTGSLGDASALAGFGLSRTGRTVVFSVMVNNMPGDKREVRSVIDSIVLALLDG